MTLNKESTVAKRPTRRGRETQAAFDAAARKVINKKNILNTTVADIAAEAGRSTASFYNYYDSKEDLLAKWAKDFRDDASRRARITAEAGLSPREVASRSVRTHVETYRDHMAEMTGVFQLAIVNREFALCWQALCDSAVQPITRMIECAQTEGYCPGLNPQITATAIVSMLNQYCYEYFSQNGMAGREDDEALIETLSEIWYRTIYWT